MDIKGILELIRAADDSSFDRVEVCDTDFVLKLERSGSGTMLPRTATGASDTRPTDVNEQAVESDLAGMGVHDITSPLVGVFHALPEGRAVKTGDRMKKGDILCMVEAMKLMNELTMPEDGEIVSVNAHNDQTVEYGDILYRYVADTQD